MVQAGTTVPAPIATPPVIGTPQDLSTPQATYRALVSQREILGEQLGSAQRLRDRLVQQVREGNFTGTTRASVEARIANADARIADLDKQIAASDQSVATAAAVPGATVRPPQPPSRTDPADVVGALGAVFMFVVLLPLSIAYARRIWRRSAKAEVTLPPHVAERMESIERGVEAIAIEVERIGEGQRFLTQTMADRMPVKALPVPESVPRR